MTLRLIFALLLVGLCSLSAYLTPALAQKPDNTRPGIVFISDRTGTDQIYRLDANGQITQITDNELYKDALDISPDGQYIIYVAGRTEGSRHLIYAVRVDGTGDHEEVDMGGYIAGLAWSPVENVIAYTNGRDIFVTDSDVTNRPQQLLIYSGTPLITLYGWSPDGQQILFGSAEDGELQLYAMNADGSDIHQITHTSIGEYRACGDWSPDGKSIAFHEGYAIDVSEIYVMDLRSNQERRLTDLQVRANCPKWSPDGTQMLFYTFAFEEWVSRVYIMNADGSELHILAKGTAPAWIPSDDGELSD